MRLKIPDEFSDTGLHTAVLWYVLPNRKSGEMTQIERPTDPIKLTSRTLYNHMTEHGHKAVLRDGAKENVNSDLGYRPYVGPFLPAKVVA